MERVKADKLRPGDRLLLPDGNDWLELERVQHGKHYMTLTSSSSSACHARSFRVPVSCRFLRVVMSRKINTRPDLVGVE